MQQALIVADAEPLSIPEMISLLRRGLGRRPGLIPVPPRLLELALRAAGREQIYQRLAGSLIAAPSALMTLGWTPRVSTAEGLAALMRE
jgi:nucleoside-diphosphate-sugar epimerase